MAAIIQQPQLVSQQPELCMSGFKHKPIVAHEGVGVGMFLYKQCCAALLSPEQS